MAPKLGSEILYLAKADIAALGIGAREMNAALDSAFRAMASARAWSPPKLAVKTGGGNSFSAKGGAMAEPAYAALKWFGYFPGNEAHGLSHYVPMIFLNEGATGMPVAVMDGVWISALRTGCLSAVAAKYMARPESSSIGFVACGSQARTNLEALSAVFNVKRIKAYSRRRSSAEAFCAEARAKGLEAEIAADSHDAVKGVDIVVSSVPHGAPDGRFLDGNDVSPGTFVAMVDLGYGWNAATLGAFDRVVTDDLKQNGPGGIEHLNYEGEYAGEVADLCSGRIVGRTRPEERNAFVFSGFGLADTAAAALVYETALKKGAGRVLPI